MTNKTVIYVKINWKQFSILCEFINRNKRGLEWFGVHGGQGESTPTCVEIMSQWQGKAQKGSRESRL
jgi:hypothetical protein